MLNAQAGLEIAQRWLQDWNNHDLEAILSHYAEEIEFTSPFVVKLMNRSSGTLMGKTDLRAYFAKGLAAFPELKFEPLQILLGVDSIVIYYRSYRSAGDLLAAEFMIINPQGLVSNVNAHYSSTV
ncbi:MAG: nuclear transport factor 2 family protein [Leptolyngbya sp. ERB_1_1]|mgnify:CR=1 FL=1